MYARYTVVLKDLMEDALVMPKISDAMSTYPLYSPKKLYDMIPAREELNKKILNHYKYNEIGFETVGRFLDELEITLNEIMPYYNEMYKSVEIMADIENPFGNVDITETYTEEHSDNASREATGKTTDTGSRESTQSSEDSSTDSNKVRFSDTPQNDIDNIVHHLTTYTVTDDDHSGSASVDNTESTTSEGNTESSSTEQTSGTVNHTLHRKGNHGVNTYAHDMIEFRTVIIDVTAQIVADERLQELFMMVY